MVILDKHTTKMLRYIKRKDTPTAGEIIKKFINGDSDMELINLCREGYLLCKKDDGTFTNFVNEPLVTSYTFKYWATPLTDKYLEDKFSDLQRWMLPTILSIISLVMSLITLLYSVLNKSPILVRLLQ